MYKPAKRPEAKKEKKRYSSPKVTTHGNVAKLTRKHPHPWNKEDGPESQIGD